VVKPEGLREDDAHTGQKPQEEKDHSAKPENSNIYEFVPQQYTRPYLKQKLKF